MSRDLIFILLTSLFINNFSVAIEAPEAEKITCEKNSNPVTQRYGIQIASQLKMAPELQMKSREAIEAHERLFQYLKDLLAKVPESTNHKGAFIGEGMGFAVYSMQGFGETCLDREGFLEHAQVGELRGEEALAAIIASLEQEHMIDAKLLTEKAVMDEINSLPLDAQTLLLRLKLRTALVLRGLQKDTFFEERLPANFQNLQTFLTNESSIHPEFRKVKVEALARGYVQAQFDYNPNSGMGQGIITPKGLPSLRAEGPHSPKFDLISIVRLENIRRSTLTFPNGKVTYTVEAMDPEKDEILLNTYREAGIPIIQFPANPEKGDAETSTTANHVVLEGRLKSVIGETGFSFTQPVAYNFPRAPLPRRAVKGDNPDLPDQIPEGIIRPERDWEPRPTHDIINHQGTRPLLVFVKPL